MKNIQFDFKESGLDESSFENGSKKLEAYRIYMQKVVEEGDFAAPEASLNCPSDTLSLQTVEDAIAVYKKPELKYVVVVGIGGSSLGAQAVSEALFGVYDTYKRDRFPKLLFLNTINEERLTTIRELLIDEAQDDREFVINVISKSGHTTETIANFEILHNELSKYFGDISDRIVVTTEEGSLLWDQAHDLGYKRLPIQKRVGGRYSVFSPVGLFPLGLAGVPIRELLEGACVMREECLSSDWWGNPALVSALALYEANSHGNFIHNSFFFSPQMESVGKWCRQLVGESLGKEEDIDGNKVHAGITPIISIGSTDLHSMAQLYFGGPRDKFTTIITVQDMMGVHTVPEATVFERLVENMNGKSAVDLMRAIISGVHTTYKKLKLPFIVVEFPELSAFTLGQYLQYKMMETMYMAHLMNINAFDQPSVEYYKKETQAFLRAHQ
ncbi:MAG: hypothetical protein KAR24_00080 [Candidatus Pacebacteria bacterium]|nr:hypothetical protein [Candidatus Paceibacterota bacterium]